MNTPTLPVLTGTAVTLRPITPYDVSAERERLGLRRDAELERRESARERHGDVRRARPVRARRRGRELHVVRRQMVRCRRAVFAEVPPDLRGAPQKKLPLSAVERLLLLLSFEPVGDERRKDPADRRGASGKRLQIGRASCREKV